MQGVQFRCACKRIRVCSITDPACLPTLRQGTGGEDIPRNFSMSDLHLFGGHDTMDGGHVHMALDAELDLGGLSTPLPAESKSQPPAN